MEELIQSYQLLNLENKYILSKDEDNQAGVDARNQFINMLESICKQESLGDSLEYCKLQLLKLFSSNSECGNEESLNLTHAAENCAKNAFDVPTLSYLKRVVALKFRILIALKIKNDDQKLQQLTCIWDDLLNMKEIRNCLSEEFLAKNHEITNRVKILNDIAVIRQSLTMLTKNVTTKELPDHFKVVVNSEVKQVLTYKPIILSGHRRTILCLAVSENKLYSGSKDGTIKVWNTDNLTCIATLEGHTHFVTSLVVSGDRLFSCSLDYTVKIWDNINFKLIKNLSEHADEVTCIGVYKNKLYSGSKDKTINIWDLSKLSLTKTITTHLKSGYNITCIVLVNDKLYVGFDEGSVKVCETSDSSLVATLPGHRLGVTGMTVSSNKLFVSSQSGIMNIWDLATHSLIATHDIHSKFVVGIAISGDRLYSGSLDKTVKVWDTSNMTLKATISNYNEFLFRKNEITCIAASEGKIFYGSKDKTIHYFII